MRILNKENQWFKEYVLEYRNKKAINIAYVETDIIWMCRQKWLNAKDDDAKHAN